MFTVLCFSPAPLPLALPVPSLPDNIPLSLCPLPAGHQLQHALVVVGDAIAAAHRVADLGAGGVAAKGDITLTVI